MTVAMEEKMICIPSKKNDGEDGTITIRKYYER